MEAIAYAIAGLGAVGAVLTLALKGWSTERARGEAEKRAAILDANNTVLQRDKADLADAVKKEKARGDNLYAALTEEIAKIEAGGPAGSYQRLLALIAGHAAATAAAGNGDAAVPVHDAPELGLIRDVFGDGSK